MAGSTNTMSFWQQLNQLLSETPGNIVYHLVTLFAIQATLAIALSQWRRARSTERDDQLARRLTLAALAILVARVAFLLVSLRLSGEPDRLAAARILPPLEQAVNAATALLVVWSVVPPFPGLPRLNDVITILGLLLLGVMYVFFAQEWAATAEPGVTYNGSQQSTIWGAIQLTILTLGAILLIAARFPDRGLRFFTVLALLAGHVAQFWDYPESIPTDSEAPFWIRLGHLIGFPLLAALAYRHTIQQLLAAQLGNRPAAEQLAESLTLATRVVDSPTLARTRREAVEVAAQALGAPFVGMALTHPEHPGHLSVTGTAPDEEEARQWELNLDDWPAFRLAIEQEEAVELLPEGMGARQLHDLYREMGVQQQGPLLVAPLRANENVVGVLLLGGRPEWDAWPTGSRGLVSRLAAYLARALYNARAYEEALADVPPMTPAAETAVSGRVIALEEERDRALEEAERLAGRLQQTEARLAESQEQTRHLAATLEALEEEGAPPAGADVEALEAEITTLRESLIEAEEAMAMAAAGEGELSTEWVMLTITRYSGELEEAQGRIAELQEELARRESDESEAVVTSLVQELRTPLTSIAGYTDLLLGETMGILGAKQRDFLQRVKANVERMGLLLEQVVQMASTSGQPAKLEDVEFVDVEEAVDTAVNTIISQVRKKELRLNLDIEQAIPPIPANREALCQVLIHLLNNASQASTAQGTMTLSAHTDVMAVRSGENGDVAPERFIHLAVTDSGGGIRPEDRSHVFDPQYRADNPLIAGLGDTGAGLSVAQALITAHGGRIWVDSEMGKGSTFSVLLPLDNHRPAGDDGQ